MEANVEANEEDASKEEEDEESAHWLRQLEVASTPSDLSAAIRTLSCRMSQSERTDRRRPATDEALQRAKVRSDFSTRALLQSLPLPTMTPSSSWRLLADGMAGRISC